MDYHLIQPSSSSMFMNSETIHNPEIFTNRNNSEEREDRMVLPVDLMYRGRYVLCEVKSV